MDKITIVRRKRHQQECQQAFDSSFSAMFSPTAIADFLACQHLTALNRAAAAGRIKRPYFADPGLELLIRLGQAHEQAYLIQLAEHGLTIVEIPTDGSRQDAAKSTVEAIRSGADVIYQASFLEATTRMLRTSLNLSEKEEGQE